MARRLISMSVEPSEVCLREHDKQRSLFGEEELQGELGGGQKVPSEQFTVPQTFISMAQDVAYHRDLDRWNTLYRTLWRLVHEQPHLLQLSTDDDIYQLRRMVKQVRRDSHKMKAFVRFRKVVRNGDEYFIAWHRPDHHVLRKVAPFFSRRFKAMNWSILTPLESVSWDQQSLHFAPGVPRSDAPKSDELEELWRTYYASIFNPARVKVKAMKNEMPVRYWPTMPETELIPDLLAAASLRVNEMISTSEGYEATVSDYIKTHENEQQRSLADLDELTSLAHRCTACELHCHATQTVFGAGPANARIVIVGEQPGDVEDRLGRPFVGPAGKVLNEVLAAAGIRREEVYLTNVVKHFKYTQAAQPNPRDMRGKRRLHKRPNAQEVRACKPWLTAEWELLKDPQVLVCLGSTAATALISPAFKVSQERGKLVASQLCPKTLATWHPSAILRTPDAKTREAKQAQMVDDLTFAVVSSQ